MRGLQCSPTCSEQPLGEQPDPDDRSMPGKAGQSYKVWIEAVAAFPANNPGLYRIHSTGLAAGSPPAW